MPCPSSRHRRIDKPFTREHWGVLEMHLVDPDGRHLNVQAPLPDGATARARSRLTRRSPLSRPLSHRAAWHRGRVDTRRRVIARRLVVGIAVALQLGFVVRGYTSDHKDSRSRCSPSPRTGAPTSLRVTSTGERVPVDEAWYGYRWSELVRSRGLSDPAHRRHADAGLDNQLAFLAESLDYALTHTPRDTETVFLEAQVTYWRNASSPEQTVVPQRSPGRRIVTWERIDAALGHRVSMRALAVLRAATGVNHPRASPTFPR